MKSEPEFLVIRLSSLGDIVLTVPAIRTLRENYPDAFIDYLTYTTYSDLIERSDLPVDRVKVVEREELRDIKNIVKTGVLLRRRDYDYCIDLHSIPKTILLSETICPLNVFRVKKSGIKRVILTKLNIDLIKEDYHISDAYIDAISPLIKYPTDDYSLNLPAEDVKNVLNSFGLSERYVVISPFSPKRTKEWIPERYAELIREIKSDWKDLQIVITGERRDLHRSKTILKGIEGEVYNLVGETDVWELASVISGAVSLISIDSGPSHLASAFGIPLLAIYGPTTEQLGFKPLGDNTIVIEIDLPCRPCSLHGSDRCPERHFRCMEEVTTEMLYEKFKELME